jgi:ribose-phosphate pyrophosphokinase
MKLFALNASREYGQRLAARLGTPLAAHEEREFEDGEFKIRSLESVRGERVFVCQSLAADERQSVSDKLVRLWFFCGALRDAGAESVTVIAPYLAFGRKDRRSKPRDPIGTSYLARLFEAAGVDVLVTIDAHNVAAFENSFRGRKANVEMAPLFAEHFAPAAASAARTVVLAPDAGAVKRARAFADGLEQRTQRRIELAFMEKHRSGGEVTGELFAGGVANALVIVFDDMIASGTTVARAAAACAARGAAAVHAAATHALLAPGAAAALGNAALASLVVTDSVGDARRRCAALGSLTVEVLETAPLLAAALDGRE